VRREHGEGGAGRIVRRQSATQRSRQENGKIERGQEQNMRLARYKTAMKKYDAVKHRKILRNDDLRCLDT